MNELMIGFIGAMLGAVAASVVAGMIAFLRRRVRVRGPQADAVECLELRFDRLEPLVLMLVTIQKPTLIAILGLVEAHKKDMNGGFERAYEGIRTALETYDRTLVSALAGGERKEPKE
jgi:hypothetical protein